MIRKNQQNVKYNILFICDYEGHSINKLQNGAISLILEIGKIRNIRFVGNLTLRT